MPVGLPRKLSRYTRASDSGMFAAVRAATPMPCTAVVCGSAPPISLAMFVTANTGASTPVVINLHVRPTTSIAESRSPRSPLAVVLVIDFASSGLIMRITTRSPFSNIPRRCSAVGLPPANAFASGESRKSESANTPKFIGSFSQPEYERLMRPRVPSSF